MHGFNWLGMGWMWIFWIAILIGIVLLVVWMIRSVSGTPGHSIDGTTKSPEEILKERLARGEIDRAEYEERLKSLRQ